MKVHTAAAWVAGLFLASNVFAHTVSLRLLLLATGIVLASIVVAAEKDVRALPPIWIPFLLWGAWALLSLVWSVEPDWTLKEWRNEMFYTGAGLWICYVGAQAKSATRVVLPLLGAAAATACMTALYQFSHSWDSYLAGWHGGPGDHSSALLMLMPCGVVAAWYTVRTKHGIGISLACFTLVGLFFASGYTTLNRTIWLGYAIQFVLLGAVLLARGEVGVRPSIKARITAYSLAAVAIAGCGAVILSIQSERMAIGGAKGFEEDTRIALWPEIAERIAERPLLGHGFGRGILRESLQAELKTVDTHLWHAHNLFLEAWVQLGAPGLVLLLVVLASLVRRGWSYARDPDERAAACGMALLAVVAGMLVRNMTDSLLVRQNALLFWGVIGVLFALAAKSSPARI